MPLLSHILRFVFLVLFQAFILNFVELGGYINPFLYVLFLLLLPFDTANWLLLVLAFCLGFSVDIFSDTIGMHTGACLFMAYCRPFVLSILSPRGGYEAGTNPTLRDLGLNWFVSYAAILIFLHHLVLFFLEAFSIAEFFTTSFRVLASAVFSLLLVLLAQYISVKPRQTS